MAAHRALGLLVLHEAYELLRGRVVQVQHPEAEVSSVLSWKFKIASTPLQPARVRQESLFIHAARDEELLEGLGWISEF